MTRAYFVSDVHFRNPEGPSEKAFLTFLGALSGRADTLYLVGDIFDFWVGHTTLHSDYEPLIAALAQLRNQGTEIHYFTGNHDPSAPKILEQLGIEIHTEGTVIHLDDKQVWVEHGDLIDPSSRLRRWICHLARWSLVHTVARMVPLKLAWRLSGAYTQRIEAYDRPLDPKLVNDWFPQKVMAPYDAAIIGHYHRAVRHERIVGGRKRVLIALGDWVEQMTYGRFEGTLELYRFRANELNLHPVPSGDHCPSDAS
jgi:UDP-2,3-diacylglucosamine hydrolase